MSNTPTLTREQIDKLLRELADACSGYTGSLSMMKLRLHRIGQIVGYWDKALSTLTPSASGDGSERPKRPIDGGINWGDEAEVRKFAHDADDHITKLESECDKLKQELCDLSESKAQNESEAADDFNQILAERDASRAEVERLREALGWIWSEGADLSTIRLKAKHAFTLTQPKEKP